jgi:ATP-dependent DNA ligase
MRSQTLDVLRPSTYPARPINGGPLELAPPKPGQWYYEPKYNGWRALVHAPTGRMFNRRGQPLSIAGLFTGALQRLRRLELQTGGGPVEWFDCEALCRRHRLGQATLLVFDYISPAGELLCQRKKLLADAFPAHDYVQPPLPEELYGVRPLDPDKTDPQALYGELRKLNACWRCLFYEGLVAKRFTDPYAISSPSFTR